MLDSGASHSIMPKVIMEKLGLDITKPYKDLLSFYSSKVRCLDLTKGLCVTLTQIQEKNVVVDIVVANIPPKYGMLLSRYWGETLQGTLQMDMTYATIPIFRQQRRLYRENLMKYMVRNQDQPNNYPLYSIHSNMDSFILYNDICLEEEMSDIESQSKKIEDVKLKTEIEDDNDEGLWHMDFDGVVIKEGAGASVRILDTKSGRSKIYSYKIAFQCTNNMAEYEALILGLQLLKR